MSEQSSPVSVEHFEYIAAHTATDDDFLKSLRQGALAAGIPAIAISPEQASFFQILLKLSNAKQVVEVGTLAGYSAIAMARALPPKGRVRTIEIDEKHAAFAEAQVAKSDVAGRVEVYRGTGKDVLPTFTANSADAAFLDADKSSYALYLRECLRIVRPGGLIIVDNAFAFGELFADAPQDPETPAIRAFNEIMANTPELHGIIIPLGDGCWVAVKH